MNLLAINIMALCLFLPNADLHGPIASFMVLAPDEVTLRPNGIGSAEEWTPLGGGDNYVEVGEAVRDDDTSYVSTTIEGETDDLYTL